MLEFNSIITTVLLLPICECATIRNSSKQPFLLYAKTNQWSSNTELRQKNKNQQNFNVIVNSYDVGMTALAIAGAVDDQTKFPQLDPKLAHYHTTAWRWTLRQLSLYPDIFYKKFCQLHKVWRRRFYYEDVFVPEWLKKMLVWVDNASWDKEENMTQRYNMYAKREFDKNDRYPPKKFDSNESFSNSTSIYYPGNFTNTLYDEGLPIQVPKPSN